MPQRKPKRSSSRDPFGAYREIQLSLSLAADPIEGFPSPPPRKMRTYINWPAFLNDVDFLFSSMVNQIAVSLEQAEMPIASSLTAISLNIYDFKRRLAAAPTAEEIEVQFGKMRAAVEQLAALSQGSVASGPVQDSPAWMHEVVGYEASIITESIVKRSRALHPMLQDHIELALEAEDTRLKRGSGRDAALPDLELRHAELIAVLEKLPALAERLQKAEVFTRTVRKTLAKKRTKGAPANDARDWLLIRLMWIWRDAMDQDLTIYIRRIGDGAELKAPEPQGCAAFIAHVLRRIEPVLPHELSGLERKLITLRARVPSIPLID